MKYASGTWRMVGLAFVFVLAIAVSFSRIGGIDACGNSADPILAFELVKSPAELAALFPDTCRTVALAAQERGLWLDILAFIPAYGAALILTLLAAAGTDPARRMLARGATLVVLIALCFDMWENSRMLQLIATFPGDQSTFDQLVAAPRIKFALLALAEAGAGWLIWCAAGWPRWLGLLAIGGALLTLVGLAVQPHWVMLGGPVAFLALAIVSWVRAVRPIFA